MLSAIIQQSPVHVRPGRYVVAKLAQAPSPGDYFMVTQDEEEVTVIAEESMVADLSTLEIETGFRLIEIRVATPFQGVGFLAAIARVIVETGLNLLIVSTYSKDYLLLQEQEVTQGLQALATLGFPIREV